MPLKKIRIYSGRLAQLKRPVGNNQQVRASDANPIIDLLNTVETTTNTSSAYITARSSATIAANTVTSSGGTAAAQTGTLNAVSGTITSQGFNQGIGPTTITITNSFCTTSSTVLCQITGAVVGTGSTIIQSVVPGASSFVINLQNLVALTGGVGTNIFTIKFIIL